MDGFLEALLAAVLEPLLGFLASIAQSLFEMGLGLLWALGEALLEAALEVVFREFLVPFFHFLAHGIANVFLYGVAVPFCCALCTPIVLARALSGSGSYAEKVCAGYRAVGGSVAHPGRWWH